MNLIYLGLHLPEEPGCDVVLQEAVVDGRRVDDRLAGGVLHRQEGLERLQ